MDKLQGMLETPKSIWKFGVNKQDFHSLHRSSCQADVNGLAGRAVSCPAGNSIYLVFIQHDCPSALAVLLHKHCLPIRYARDLDIIECRGNLSAVLLHNRCHLHYVHMTSTLVIPCLLIQLLDFPSIRSSIHLPNFRQPLFPLPTGVCSNLDVL